jgi:hypothetical protein
MYLHAKIMLAAFIGTVLPIASSAEEEISRKPFNPETDCNSAYLGEIERSDQPRQWFFEVCARNPDKPSGTANFSEKKSRGMGDERWSWSDNSTENLPNSPDKLPPWPFNPCTKDSASGMCRDWYDMQKKLQPFQVNPPMIGKPINPPAFGRP